MTTTKRQLIALIALRTDLPLPTSFNFYQPDTLALSLENLADGIAWSVALGGSAETYPNPDGHTYLRSMWNTWNGWHISLHAHEPTEALLGGDLLAETASALESLAHEEGNDKIEVET